MKKLEEIGLSEKEAKVYLAALEIGPSSAQNLAAKSGVSRPNTYIAIESLTQRGLMSSFQKGKRKLFCSENARCLEGVVQSDLSRIILRKNLANELIPILEDHFQQREQRVVRLIEGLDGLRLAYTDLLHCVGKKEVINNFVSLDTVRAVTPKMELFSLWEELEKKEVKIRTIYTKTGNEEIFGLGNKNWKCKRLSEKQYQFNGEFTVYRDKVLLINVSQGWSGILIEDKDIAGMLNALFQLAWIASVT